MAQPTDSSGIAKVSAVWIMDCDEGLRTGSPNVFLEALNNQRSAWICHPVYRTEVDQIPLLSLSFNVDRLSDKNPNLTFIYRRVSGGWRVDRRTVVQLDV